jgi:hypothetical protein
MTMSRKRRRKIPIAKASLVLLMPVSVRRVIGVDVLYKPARLRLFIRRADVVLANWLRFACDFLVA